MIPRFAHRLGLAFALAALLAGIAASVLYCFPLRITHRIDVSKAASWGGYAYAVPIDGYLPRGIAKTLFGFEPDSSESPSGSPLKVLEQGVPTGLPHAIHEVIRQQGHGLYSHWKDLLVFSSSDNSNPTTNGRSYSVSYPLSPAPWIPLLLLTFAGAISGLLFRPGEAASVLPRGAGRHAYGSCRRLLEGVYRNRGYLLWTGLAILGFYLNLAFFRLLPAPLYTEDTGSYANWFLVRTPGYPLFLELCQRAFGSWNSVQFVQLDLLVGGLALMAYAIARATASYLAGWLFVALSLAGGHMLLSAADLMTEAIFAAFAMAHAALVTLFMIRPRNGVALLAGVCLAVAVTVKSVATVLVGPLALLALFLPRDRKPILAMMLLPALLAWLGPSAWNLVRNGFFETSIASGYALGGHVAWAIHPNPHSAHPEAARAIEQRIMPVLSKRPSKFDSMKQYAEYTTDEYNTLLWLDIVPALMDRYSKVCSSAENCTWRTCRPNSCYLMISKTLLDLGKEAIRTHPTEYAHHVAAHDLGLWRLVFHGMPRDFLLGAAGRAAQLPAAFDMQCREGLCKDVPIPRLPTPGQRAEIVSRLQDSHVRRLVDVFFPGRQVDDLGVTPAQRHPLIIFGVAFFACLLVFRLQRMSAAAKACCYCGLCLNAYFLGTALAQPALARYASPMQGMTAALIVLGVFAAIRATTGMARAAIAA